MAVPPAPAAEVADPQRGLLEKIEDFCCRPDFTDSIATFASEHAQEFASGPVEGEHPVRTALQLHNTHMHQGTAHPRTAAPVA